MVLLSLSSGIPHKCVRVGVSYLPQSDGPVLWEVLGWSVQPCRDVGTFILHVI